MASSQVLGIPEGGIVNIRYGVYDFIPARWIFGQIRRDSLSGRPGGLAADAAEE